MTRRLMVDARTARTGGGTTVLAIVEDRLGHHLGDYELDVRRPTDGSHPVRPLVRSTTRADAILGLSESSNVGWPQQPYVMLARNWKCWGEERSARAMGRRAIALRNGRRATVVVAATGTFADAIRSRLPDTDVRTLRFGVSEVFRPHGEEAEGQYILSVGDLYRHKRFDLAIDAFARSGLRQDFELRIAGTLVDANLVEDLNDQIAAAGLPGRVRLLGRVDASSLAALYRGAAATILASDLESFGHPYVEAMASGCPVIGRRSQVAEEVTAGCATLVGPDADQMAAALESIVSADRDKIAAAGIDRSHKFTWSSWTSSLADIFREVS